MSISIVKINIVGWAMSDRWKKIKIKTILIAQNLLWAIENSWFFVFSIQIQTSYAN